MFNTLLVPTINCQRYVGHTDNTAAIPLNNLYCLLQVAMTMSWTRNVSVVLLGLALCSLFGKLCGQ
jgi:hypothetical protein